VNKGLADYTPIFLSNVPDLFDRGLVPIDVALIQTSLPDDHGYMSLGVSVDIVKAATEKAALVIAQVNASMPRVHGDGFIHVKDVSFIIPYDEPILEYVSEADSEIAQQIGKYVSRLVRDGETIQVGYGSIPNAILSNLHDKKHLGVHSELLTDGIMELMKSHVISDEPLLKDFFYSLSDNSLYRRFISVRKDMPHERLQQFVAIDYTQQLVILAIIPQGEKEIIVGVGQYALIEKAHTAEVGFAVRDEYQNKGTGTESLSTLTYLAKRQGLLGFYAEVLVENRAMLHLFEKMGFDIKKRREEGVYEMEMMFK